MNKRDNTIDFLRGLAAISVIFIHTCFWSGTSYVPVTMQSLSLLIDVPIFVLLSGMSFNFSNSILKTLKGFSKLWYKYIVFVALYYILILIFDTNNFSLTNIFSAIFFKFPGNDIFPVVPGSLWFIFMFFIVSILCDLIICLYNKTYKDMSNFKYIIIISLLLYGMSNYTPGFTFITTNIFMYSFIYLLGYYLYNYKIKNITKFITMFIGLILLYLAFNKSTGLDQIQIYKSACDIRYLLYSLFSILTVFFIKDRLKINFNNALAFVGRNALLFYFAQGISSSILYFILPKITISIWYIKLLVMFVINIVITTALSLIIKYLCDITSKIKLNNLVFIENKVETPTINKLLEEKNDSNFDNSPEEKVKVVNTIINK